MHLVDAQSAFPGLWGLNVGILPKEGRVVSEMESNDDDSLDGVDWKEEKFTEQDKRDAEEELPPELRYNGDGENKCSEKRVVNEDQAVIPALTRVDEMAVIPDLKQLVEEKAVILDPTLRVYESV